MPDPAQKLKDALDARRDNTPYLTVTIEFEDSFGYHRNHFTVAVEGGWQLHKVAAEIEHNVKNAYRIGIQGAQGDPQPSDG